ncbi:MAG: prepilin-type N-terminal cleavage/methylation domain-containing protein [Planctomycetota bacterium]
MRPRNLECARRGYTLVELLVVIAIIAGLAGLGLGFLRAGGNKLDLAMTELRDLARIAHTRAQFFRAPARLLIDRPLDEDGIQSVEDSPLRLRVVALLAVSEWNFDDGSARGAKDAGGELIGGHIDKGGRIGKALFPDQSQGGPGVRVRLKDMTGFDLRRGLVMRVHLYLEDRNPCVPLRIGNQVELAIGAADLPEAMVTLAENRDRPSETLRLRGMHRVPLGRWFELALSVDASHARLQIDSLTQAVLDVKGKEVYLRDESDLVISDAGQPVPGRVDEVSLFSYETVTEIRLPQYVEILSGPMVLHFDARGMLDPRFHLKLPVYRLSYHDDQDVVRFDRGGLSR